MSERSFQEALIHELRELNENMTVIADLTTAISNLATAVDSFIAAQPTADDEAAEATGLTTAVASLNDLTAKVVAATPVATPPPTTLAFAAATLNVTSGAAVSDQLTATGGLAPYQFNVTNLPSGLTADVTGLVTGTTTSVGTLDAAVTVTDASTPQETATGTLTVVVA